MLRFAIQAAGGLIQHEYARILEDDARQGNTLFFTTAQAITALADDGVILVGQPGDEIVNVGCPCSMFQFRLGGIQPGIEKIGTDGIVKQIGLLGDHADLATDKIQRQIAQVIAIQQHTAMGGVIQARNQIGDGGLTCPAGTDQCGQLARFSHKIDVFQSNSACLT